MPILSDVNNTESDELFVLVVDQPQGIVLAQNEAVATIQNVFHPTLDLDMSTPGNDAYSMLYGSGQAWFGNLSGLIDNVANVGFSTPDGLVKAIEYFIPNAGPNEGFLAPNLSGWTGEQRSDEHGLYYLASPSVPADEAFAKFRMSNIAYNFQGDVLDFLPRDVLVRVQSTDGIWSDYASAEVYYPPILRSLGPPTVSEEQSHLIFEYELNRPADDHIQIRFSTLEGTALGFSDYSPRFGMGGITQGSKLFQVFIPIVNDAIPESTEFMTLRLQPAGGRIIIESELVQGTIVDQDA